jgi:hypothetical protein
VFVVDSQVILKSNVRVLGAGSALTRFRRTSAGPATHVFYGAGTYDGVQYNITAPLGLGARDVTFTGSHTFAAGEPVWVIGQRDSLTAADAGEEWTLGYATPSTSGCLFGEMNVVQASTSATSVKLAAGVVFPNYRHDGSLETSSSARSATSIRKVNWLREVSVEGFTVEMQRAVPTAIRMDYAFNCLAKDIKTDAGLNDCASIHFLSSFLCFVRDSTATHSPRDYTDLEKVPNIDYKAISSHSVHFDRCRSFHGTQAFDFTYTGGRTPSLFCSVTNSQVYNARLSGMTSHPGSYAILVHGNQFIGCRQGAVVRSRKSVVSSNLMSGDEAIATTFADAVTDRLFYGVGLYEGWARDCVVANNSITGFNVGVMVADAVDPGECFDYVGADICHNIITRCFFGFMRDTMPTKLSTALSGICFTHNSINWCYRPIYVENYCADVMVHGNRIRNMLDTAANAIEFAPECPMMDVQFNRLVDIGATNTGIKASSSTPGLWPFTITAGHILRNNRFLGTFSAKYNANATYVETTTSFDAAGRGEGALVLTDGITAPSSASGRAQLFVDTADGDLKVIFADGVVKTISTDT